jgi:prepilin-type N-terminal cleavage/methylation domain-containing protein
MALRRRKHAGFTVIEVLVALTLMAMVILLVTRAFLVVLSVTSQGGRVTSATALAAKQLEAIRTTVEAQPSRDAWRTAFCGIAAAGRSAFAAPYGSYEYQVLLNDTAVSARSGQENDLLPCWAVEWSRTGCGTQPGYAGGGVRRRLLTGTGRPDALGDRRGLLSVGNSTGGAHDDCDHARRLPPVTP